MRLTKMVIHCLRAPDVSGYRNVVLPSVGAPDAIHMSETCRTLAGAANRCSSFRSSLAVEYRQGRRTERLAEYRLS